MLRSHISTENFQNLLEAHASGELMSEERVSIEPNKSKLFVKFDTKGRDSAPAVLTKKVMIIGEQNRDNAILQDLLLCTGGRFENSVNNVSRTGIRCVNYSERGVGFMEVTAIPTQEMEDALRDPTKSNVMLDSLVGGADVIMLLFDCNKSANEDIVETPRSVLQIWQKIRNYFDIQKTVLKEQTRVVLPLHHPNMNLLSAYLMDRNGPESALIDKRITGTCDLFQQLDAKIQFCPPTTSALRECLSYY